MKRRGGLGRGLDALIPQEESVDQSSTEGLRRVPVSLIDPNPRQPRSKFDEEELQELATSIRELGVLQPLLVRTAEDRFRLIAGERRLRASKLAGLEEVPVMIVETDDRGSLERALVENIHRANLNPIEEASAYKELMEEGELTQDALAQRLGRNRVSVTNALRLLDLPSGVQKMLIDGKLSAGHGKALAALMGNPFQERLGRRAAQEKLSVRETEELVRRYQSMSGDAASGGRSSYRPPEVAEAQRRLSDHLQTKVRVVVGQRKGKITVDFSTIGELERVMSVILGDGPGGDPTTVTPE